MGLHEMSSHDANVPRPRVLQVLRILVETRASFGTTFDDEVYFLESIAKVRSGERKWASIGDVDILIGGEHMAQSFWTFLRALLERKLRSVWDVCDVPEDVVGIWKPCNPRKEHPLSLTLDCEANQRTSQGPEFKQYNLDVKLDPSIVSKVPMSSRWMYGNYLELACNDFRAAALHTAFLNSEMLYPS